MARHDGTRSSRRPEVYGPLLLLDSLNNTECTWLIKRASQNGRLREKCALGCIYVSARYDCSWCACHSRWWVGILFSLFIFQMVQKQISLEEKQSHSFFPNFQNGSVRIWRCSLFLVAIAWGKRPDVVSIWEKGIKHQMLYVVKIFEIKKRRAKTRQMKEEAFAITVQSRQRHGAPFFYVWIIQQSTRVNGLFLRTSFIPCLSLFNE